MSMKTRTRTPGGIAPWQKSQDRFKGESNTHTSDVPRGDGGGRKNSGAGIIQVAGRSFWPPAGLPVPHYDDKDKLVVKGPGESYVRKGEEVVGIFFAGWQGFFGHRVQRTADLSFLPPKLDRTTAKNRKFLLYKSYPCTYETTGSPDHADLPDGLGEYGVPDAGSWDSYDPTQHGWAEYTDDRSGRDLWIKGSPDSPEVSVSQTAAGAWVVNPPELLAVQKRWHREPWEDLGFALYLAHCLLIWSETCGFCAQQRWEQVNKVKKEDQKVWRPDAQILLPFFSLGWVFGHAHKSDPEKAGDFKFDGNNEPEGDEVAIRQGLTFFRVRHKTKRIESKDFQAFGRHIATTENICKSCLVDGKIRDDLVDGNGKEITNPHEITVLGLHCANCDHEVVDKRTVRRADLYSPIEKDKETGLPIIEKAGLHQLKYMHHTCPNCGHVGYPNPVVQCNTCDNPTPLHVHEVVSKASAHTEGGYLTFSIVEGDDGRIYWDDFSDLALANPAGECGYANTVEEVFFEYRDAAEAGDLTSMMDCMDSEDYATKDWKPQQQVQFIGGDVLGVASKDHSEPR